MKAVSIKNCETLCLTPILGMLQPTAESAMRLARDLIFGLRLRKQSAIEQSKNGASGGRSTAQTSKNDGDK